MVSTDCSLLFEGFDRATNSRGGTAFVESYCQSLYKTHTKSITSRRSRPSFAASLTTPRKKDGGIRPIAVGNVFRRLASKVAAKRAIPELRRKLPPVQHGVSGGCEVAAHAVRAFVQP